MSPLPAPDRDTRSLRVVSWNLWELRGDLRALVAAVRDLDPDVLLVQEAPRFVLPRTRLDWFARQTGRRVLVGGGLGGRGLAILGTDAVARQVVRRGAHGVRQRLSDANSTYPRGVAAVRMSVPGGGDLLLAVTHLALQEDNRIAHARHLAELVAGAGAPVVLGGDLNETADGPARRLLAEHLRDAAEDGSGPDPAQWTFPARDPQRRIDAVLTSGGVAVRRAQAVPATATVPAERLAGASDHLPTLLDLTVPEPTRPGDTRPGGS